MREYNILLSIYFYLRSVNKSHFRILLKDTARHASIGRELIFEGCHRIVYSNNNILQFHNIKYDIYNL